MVKGKNKDSQRESKKDRNKSGAFQKETNRLVRERQKSFQRTADAQTEIC